MNMLMIYQMILLDLKYQMKLKQVIRECLKIQKKFMW